MITGILSISNGSGLKYPYPVVVSNLQRFCDDVIVGVDPNFPLDRSTLELLNFSNVKLVDAVWNLENRQGGTEIALQMDNLVDLAKEQGSDWVVVMQADELIHDEDFSMLRAFMERYAGSDTHGFSMERIYFWKDLKTIRTDWNARMVRIFQPGAYSFLAEGTSKDGMYSGPVKKGVEVYLPYKIYHYSRVGSPASISHRVRNLDAFFHPDEALIPKEELPEYDFIPRAYDNFSVSGFPEEVGGEFMKYLGKHPVGVSEWYDE